MVTYILLGCILLGVAGILMTLSVIKYKVDCLWKFVYGELNNQDGYLEEYRKRIDALEKYICGKGGRFEDSIKNGSSLNSIVNAILLEVAKLNPDGWQVGVTEDKTLYVASDPVSNVVEKVEQNPKVDVPSFTEEETDDSDEKISFEEEDFTIEEE
jgi:hypothetical protein